MNLNQKNDIKKILVMRLDRLGDIILTIPALRALRAEFPYSQITLFVPESLSGLHEFKKYSDNIICFKKNNIIESIFKLRKTKFDIAIDFLSRSDYLNAVVFFFVRAKEKLSFNNGLRRLFLTKKINLKKEDLYEVDISFKLLETIGIFPKNKKLELTFSVSDEEAINSKLKEHKINNNDILIGIHALAGDLEKAWKIEKFKDLTRKLLEKYPVKIILTGSPDEKEKIEASFRGFPVEKVINMAGETSLTQLIALINKFTIFISNNTGPMHIAVSLETPLLLINGYSSLIRWGPQQGVNYIIKKEYSCIPCEFAYGAKCLYNDYRCINDITVDDILCGFEKLRGKCGKAF